MLVGTNARKTPSLGGTGGSPLSRTGPAGATVIGFPYNFGNWGGRSVLKTFEPIFSRSAKPAETKGFGGQDVEAIQGRDGYVVTGLLVDTDDTNACAARIRFVRLKDGLS